MVRSALPIRKERLALSQNDLPHRDPTDGERPAPDTLNERIGVLARREVEARLLAPILEALGREFGHDRVRAIVRQQIVAIARQQGSELATAMGGDSLACFADSLQFWSRDEALELDVLELSPDSFAFNVTRCRYAEMYRDLGIPELGAVLSCNRDFALIEGFNDEVQLTRTQTIMDGASHCDFRYRLPAESSATEPD